VRKEKGVGSIEYFRQRGIVSRVLRIPIPIVASTAVQDTGINLPAKALVREVLLDVRTAEATGGTKTVDVGLLASESGGDEDGFIDGISVSATGIKQPRAVVDAGGTEAEFTSTTRGAFMATFVAGAESAGDVGTHFEFDHLTDSVTSKSITYTLGDTDFAELDADILIKIDEFE